MNITKLYKKHLLPIIFIHIGAIAVAIDSYRDTWHTTPYQQYPFTYVTPLFLIIFTCTLIALYCKHDIPNMLSHGLFITVLSFGIIGAILFPLWIHVYGFNWWRAQNIFSHLLFGLEAFILVPYLKKMSALKHIILTILYGLYASFALQYSTYFQSTFPFKSTMIFATVVLLVSSHLYTAFIHQNSLSSIHNT